MPIPFYDCPVEFRDRIEQLERRGWTFRLMPNGFHAEKTLSSVPSPITFGSNSLETVLWTLERSEHMDLEPVFVKRS